MSSTGTELSSECLRQVGERRVIDNCLALTNLRRLDQLSAGQMPGAPVTAKPRPAARKPIDWDLALDALRTGEPDAVAEALAMIDGHKIDEIDDPLNRSPAAEEDAGIDLSDRCWSQDEMGETVWMTDFPPPPGFDGYQKGDWRDLDYERECTPEEAALLAANHAAFEDEEEADDAALRDAWFAMLRGDTDEQLPAAEDGRAAGE